jgi:hypothetical protein
MEVTMAFPALALIGVTVLAVAKYGAMKKVYKKIKKKGQGSVLTGAKTLVEESISEARTNIDEKVKKVKPAITEGLIGGIDLTKEGVNALSKGARMGLDDLKKSVSPA